ncbi:MAG TPA: RNA polymerase sigma factor [Flavitalea sp.]|nr:RNA polymerase sigma factor [Flavitalea sp.]
MSTTDTYLIAQIQKSNEAIFTLAYQQYHARLYFYFLKKTQSESTGADLVKTTFIKCWRFREQLNPEISFSLQLFRIAKTTFIDLLRQKARERLVSLEACNSVNDIVDEPAATHPYLDQVKATLDKISPERSKIIQFRLQGLTNPEIAQHLGISKKTVENQLNKAVKEIRCHLTSSPGIAVLFFLFCLLYK